MNTLTTAQFDPRDQLGTYADDLPTIVREYDENAQHPGATVTLVVLLGAAGWLIAAGWCIGGLLVGK